MRSRFLFGLVAVGLLFSLKLQGQKQKLSPNLSVRQQFDTELANLRKNILVSKKTTDKLKALAKSEKDIEQMRNANPAQVDPDEVHMNMVLASLKLVPRGNDFNKEKCGDYRTEILAAFDPKAGEKPNPPISETLSVLDTLCQ